MDIYNNIDEREFNFDDEEEGPTSLVDDEGDFAKQIIENDYKEAIKAYDSFALKEMGITSLVIERGEPVTPVQPPKGGIRDSGVGGVVPGILGGIQFGQIFQGEARGAAADTDNAVASARKKPRTRTENQQRAGEQIRRTRLNFPNYPNMLSRLFTGNVRSAIINPSTYEFANKNTKNTIQQTLTRKNINNKTKRNIISGLFRAA